MTREDIAHRHGFERFCDMLDASAALPKLSGDTVQSYVGQCPNGTWFVWDDVAKEPADDKRDEH